MQEDQALKSVAEVTGEAQDDFIRTGEYSDGFEFTHKDGTAYVVYTEDEEIVVEESES